MNNKDSFESLIKDIISCENVDKSEQFIRDNIPKILPLVRWLSKLIIILDNNNYTDCHPDRKVSTSSTCSQLSQDEYEDLNEGKNEILAMSLDCMLIISSSASLDNSVENEICNTVIEQINFLEHINKYILNCRPDYHLERYLAIIVNFTRFHLFVEKLVSNVLNINNEYTSFRLYNFLPKLIQQIGLVESKHRHLYAAYLNNLCQSETVRCCLIKNKLFSSLFELYNEYLDDAELRRYIIELVRNCCLDYKYHPLIINDEDEQFLIDLVFPLAGGEEMADQEMRSLPLDLQYLPLNKKRENDKNIRRLLIESIHLLCTTRYGRELVRKSNIYYHLREYHRWEEDLDVSETLMKLIDLIIKDEKEINVDNLKEMVIPDDLVKKFQEMAHDEQSSSELK